MTPYHLTLAEVSSLAYDAAIRIVTVFPHLGAVKVYGIPRGGIPAAYAIGQFTVIELVDHPEKADVIVDDLIDSGATVDNLLATLSHLPKKPPVFALIDKTRLPQGHHLRGWVVFPWENTAAGSIEDNIRRILQFIGEDCGRGGLQETPKRVAKAWRHWAGGYDINPASLLKVFEDGAENVNEMIIVKDIPFYSHCEHHMAPFFGKATVAYIPNGRIVGLSKINRVVDAFARRLQVQERLTTQIADTINYALSPKGVGVIINARHLCMESRGVCQHGHSTTTSALRGVMSDGPVRQEFLQLARGAA